MIKICAGIIVGILLFLTYPIDISAQIARPTSFDKRPICEESNGSWRQFGNGCADGCYSKFNRFSMCTQSIAYSCDCGRNRCWDGNKCNDLKEYKIIYEALEKEKQVALDERKEERKAIAIINRNQILAKLLQKNTPPQGEGQQNNQNKNNSNNNPLQDIPAPEFPTIPQEAITYVPSPRKPSVDVKIPPLFLKKMAQKEALTRLNDEFESKKDPSDIEDIVPALPQIALPK